MEEFFAKVSLEIIVILVAAIIGREAFKKVNQSPVLGELLAGIILGPAVLNFFHPQENIIISYLALLGITVFLFEVGLETDLAKLERERLNSAVVALSGAFLLFVVGSLLIYVLSRDALLAFFVGAAIVPTSVGITVRILEDYHKLRTKEGRIVLGAVVVDDIAGLVLLSIALNAAQTPNICFMDIIGTASTIAIFLGMAIFVGVRFTRNLMRLVRKARTRGALETSLFLFCVCVACLAAKAGMALIIGAFIAGLMLENFERKEYLLPKIQFLTDIFVPLYFVSAGAAFSFVAIANLRAILILLMFVVIVLAARILSGFALSAFMEKKGEKEDINPLMIAAGMLPRGEVCLVFASAGLLVGVLDVAFYSIIVGVVMLTTIITPLALRYLLVKEKTASQKP